MEGRKNYMKKFESKAQVNEANEPKTEGRKTNKVMIIIYESPFVVLTMTDTT